MDPLIASGIVTAINVVGWVYTKVFALGKLKGTVEKLDETCQRHEKLLNDGLVQDLSDLKAEVANLNGTVRTYIDLTKNR
jgi:hypothetical protein